LLQHEFDDLVNTALFVAFPVVQEQKGYEVLPCLCCYVPPSDAEATLQIQTIEMVNKSLSYRVP
jgi:hypothetical protein